MALRLVGPKTIEFVAEAQLPTEIGEFRIIGFRSLISTEEFVALVKGELRTDRSSLVRIHSQCMTGDVFGSVKCDCGRQLDAAMKLIEQEGHGAIVYQTGGARHRHHQQDPRLRPARRRRRHDRSQRVAWLCSGLAQLRTMR